MRENRGFIVGLAVALFGGALVLGLLIALFTVTSDTGTSATVTVRATPTASPSVAATAASTAASALPPQVVAGARDFVAFSCGACHGLAGKGDVTPDVPGLTGAGKEFTAGQLRQIIDRGAGVSSNPTKVFMPVWGAIISDRQVADLVAYIRAGLPSIPNVQPIDVPAGANDAAAGSALYERYGCGNCHGPNGLGGVPNPSSPDKAVPPLSGAGFRKGFGTPAAIAAVIHDGSVIGKQPIVSMPHWGGILTTAQIGQLVAFIDTLK